jgi:molybdopterin-guanine dinucleotide biosynthesis protein A
MTDPLVVLAGGRSGRFDGGDKALADLGGTPMIRQVADRLAPATDGLVVNCRRDQRAELSQALAGHDPRFALDPVPDEGPVAGLLTALRTVGARRALVVGCDMPFLDADLADRLLAGTRDADAAVPVVGGRVQPLGAAYRVRRARAACVQTLACGSRRLADVPMRLDAARVAVPARALRDLDTRAAVETAALAFK